MDKPRFHLIFASIIVLGSAFLAEALKPRARLEMPGRLNLEETIPRAFGEWTLVPDMRLVEPQGERSLSKEIYGQEIARGYADKEGRMVMLLVAYGPSQSDRLQLHRPEICYSAQGFRIEKRPGALLGYANGRPLLLVSRLVTQREGRLEPVTYWMRIGYDVSTDNLRRQLVKLRYGLAGFIPDGTLIRTSTVGLSAGESFTVQDRFIKDLLTAVPRETLGFLVGYPNKALL